MIYRIEYVDSNVVQYKRLISHADYLATKELSEDEQKIKLHELSGGMEWFTENSPIYKAIATGIYEVPNFKSRCIVSPRIDSSDNDGWVSHNGCNACVNSTACEHLNCCLILVVDKEMPTNCKRKRHLISQIRAWGSSITPEHLMHKINLSVKRQERADVRTWGQNKNKKYRTSGGSVKLTRLEQMFLEELNKPR